MAEVYQLHLLHAPLWISILRMSRGRAACETHLRMPGTIGRGEISLLFYLVPSSDANVPLYSDMKDRIGIRGNIRAELMWTEPLGEAPDWRVWRDCSRASNAGSQDNFNDANLCRSMRAFVGWKPSGTKARERRK